MGSKRSIRSILVIMVVLGAVPALAEPQSGGGMCPMIRDLTISSGRRNQGAMRARNCLLFALIAGCNQAQIGMVPEMPDAGPALRVAGTITIGENRMYTGGGQMVYAGAAFAKFDATDQPEKPVATEGGCSVYVAADTAQDPMSMGGAAGQTLDAGAIDIRGGARSIKLLMMAGEYASDVPQSATQLFSDGQTLTIEGAGGADVPAFQLEVSAPNTTTPVSPDFSRGLDLTKAAGLAVEWRTGAASSAFLEVVAGGTDPVSGLDGQVTLSCAANDVSRIDIPAALLAHLPSTTQAMLMITRTSTTTAIVNDARVQVNVESVACTMGRIRE